MFRIQLLIICSYGKLFMLFACMKRKFQSLSKKKTKYKNCYYFNALEKTMVDEIVASEINCHQ